MSSRNGFTLIEIVVVLLVLAVVATFTAPALNRAPESNDGTLIALVARARDTALRRAESLELRVDSDGTWELLTDGTLSDRPIDSGQLVAAVPGALVVRISPLGACLFVRDAAAVTASWDAVRCGHVRKESGR